MKDNVPDLVLLDLGLGGSTTIGVEICRETKARYPETKSSFLLVKYLTKNFGLMSWSWMQRNNLERLERC